jgi:hypothetical protein
LLKKTNPVNDGQHFKLGNYNSILAPIHTCSCFRYKTLSIILRVGNFVKGKWAMWNGETFRSLVNASRKKNKQFKKWRVIQTETLELKIEDFFLFRRDNITWRWVPYRRRNRTKKNEKIIRNGGNVYADVDSIEILFKMKKNTIACVVFLKRTYRPG